MLNDDIVSAISVIYAGAALAATLAMVSRQSIQIAYMMLGIVLGPFGLAMVSDQSSIEGIGHVGMIFLLFLAGLHLDPNSLLSMLKRAVTVTLGSSFLFAAVGFLVCFLFGFSITDAFIVGAAMMFSSTLLGLKLLPNNLLHRHHIGEIMISVLIIQDLLAIASILVIKNTVVGSFTTGHMLKLVLALPSLLIYAFYIEEYFLSKLFYWFEGVREYLFVLSVGWCLSLSLIASWLGMSHEIGAFIAGVTIASGSIATYLAECFNPVRDFFLVLFFFSVGANLNMAELSSVIGPVLILSAVVVVFKPLVYWWLMKKTDKESDSWESGVRLGQASEFSLILSQIASGSKVMSGSAVTLVQAVVMVSFVISSYWVTKRFETPTKLNTLMMDD